VVSAGRSHGWLAAVSFAAALGFAAAQIGHVHDEALPPAPSGALRDVGLLLRESRTNDARTLIDKLLRDTPGDAELYHQLARSYLLDFYEGHEPAKKRTSLALAMEALANALARNPHSKRKRSFTPAPSFCTTTRTSPLSWRHASLAFSHPRASTCST
jgi:hypothetical protein